MLDIEKHGIAQIKLPLPFKLNHVNCYAVRCADGWAIIDTGLNYWDSRQAWERFFVEKNITPRDIKEIYVTHYHPDHYGSAGWLQQLSGAPVYMTRTEALLARRIWDWNPQNKEVMSVMFRENGVPEKLVSDMMVGMDQMIPRVNPHPKITELSGDIEVDLGGCLYRVIITPGHSDGHFCLYCEEHGILFSGDHLLPKITSNISLWPHSLPDPLDNFMNSLNENKTLKTEIVLPSHGPCFDNLRERIGELEEHHRQRLETMKRAVGEKGATVYQVSRRVFGEELSLHEIRFALTETLAHLVHLEKRGELKVERVRNVNVYYAVKP